MGHAGLCATHTVPSKLSSKYTRAQSHSTPLPDPLPACMTEYTETQPMGMQRAQHMKLQHSLSQTRRATHIWPPLPEPGKTWSSKQFEAWAYDAQAC